MATTAVMPRQQHRLAMLIGERIARLRRERGWSRRRLAEEMKCTHPSVAQIEGGWNYPTYEHLMRLSEIFGVSPNDLLAIKDDERPWLTPCQLKQLFELRSRDNGSLVDGLEELVKFLRGLPQTAI